MKELDLEEVRMVAGNGAGHVGVCIAGGGLGGKLGSAFGPWGGVAGAGIGCGLSLVLYNS